MLVGLSLPSICMHEVWLTLRFEKSPIMYLDPGLYIYNAEIFCDKYMVWKFFFVVVVVFTYGS